MQELFADLWLEVAENTEWEKSWNPLPIGDPRDNMLTDFKYYRFWALKL